MCKKYKFEGKLEIQENKKETKDLSAKGTFEEIKCKEKYVPKTYCGWLFMPYLICLGLILFFCNENNLLKSNMDLYIFIIILSIFIIILYSIIFISLNNTNKLRFINKIIEDSNIEKISDTTTSYDKEGHIEKITSSDQQAKVLIAAIEAIKEL